MFEAVNIAGKSFEELMSLFLCDVDGDDDYYDTVAYHLANEYRPQLESILPVLMPTRLRAAICGLGLSDSSASDSLIQTFLDHGEPLVVAAAIDALRRTGATEWTRVADFLQHGSPYVRGAALRFCKARLGKASSQLLFSALKDGDEIVRQNALDELGDVATESDLASITPLLRDPSNGVRQAAATLVAAIRG